MSTFKFLLLLSLINTVFAADLKLNSGDVVLISFNCYECKVIESETNSNFSHSGVVLVEKNGSVEKIQVAQSLGMVALYTLPEFLKNRTPGSKAFVYRALELESIDQSKLSLDMKNVFDHNFKGLFFDSRYLWDNFDSSGNELLYCSEFIAKYLDFFQSVKTVPYKLTYMKNYEYWKKYFKGDVPEGVLGNSPASFSTDKRFKFVGTID